MYILDMYKLDSQLKGTAFRKDSLEKNTGIEFKNRGSADQLHET